MNERKDKINSLSDGFIALPGGFGTLDELFEVCTLMQLGHIQKPIAMLNTGNYYDMLIKMLDRALADQFIKSSHRRNILSVNTPAELISQICEFKPQPNEEKWIDNLKQNNRYL